MRAKITLAGLVLLVGTASACGGAGATPDAGGTESVASATATSGGPTTAPSPVPTPSTGPDLPPVGCPQLRDRVVGTPATPLADFEPVRVGLEAGRYAADGATIELQDACAFGDLDGDGSRDAVGAVLINTGGSGRWFTVVVWLGSGYELETSLPLGDRNPVRELKIAADGSLTIVYLTRSADAPTAEVDIKRTATYDLTPSGLVEIGHTDETYYPLADG